MSLDYLNECLQLDKVPIDTKFRHSTVYYVKSLLEAKFKPSIFTLDEVEGLLQEVFKWKDN